MWNIQARKFLWQHRFRDAEAQSLKFSPDGRYIACRYTAIHPSISMYATKGKLRVFDSRTGEIIAAPSAETSANRRQQDAIGAQQQLAIRSGKKLSAPRKLRFLPGDSGTVESLAWSPDSRKLAAAYANGEIKLWRVP